METMLQTIVRLYTEANVCWLSCLVCGFGTEWLNAVFCGLVCLVRAFACFLGRHGLAFASSLGLVLGLWTLGYWCLFFWAMVEGSDLGGALVFPVGLVVLFGVTLLGCALVCLPAVAGSEWIGRRFDGSGLVRFLLSLLLSLVVVFCFLGYFAVFGELVLDGSVMGSWGAVGMVCTGFYWCVASFWGWVFGRLLFLPTKGRAKQLSG